MSVPSFSAPGRQDVVSPGRMGTSAVGRDRPAGYAGPRQAADRPSQREVGDFLGINQPLRDVGGTTVARPDQRTVADRRPGVTEVRPGVSDRRPAAMDARTGIADRRPETQRPIDIGGRTNNLISVRPSWSNISNERATSVRNNWRNSVVNQPNAGRWQERHPERTQRLDRWGDDVRRNWDREFRNRDWDWDGDVFDHDWWEHHHHPIAGWHYWNNINHYSYNYWWTVPTWAGVTGWFAWPETPQVWTQPVYYDYGQGGNVTYSDNVVYVNDQQIGTAEEFAQSAAQLATVDPPASQEQAAQAEWMPLGTFAVSSSEVETTPSRIVQLAVDKQGVISGTLYNTQTDYAQTVQGQVDKETQRVAMRVGDNQDMVMETGLYNLTQDQAPVLVHFGTQKVENYLLVRLEASQSAKQSAQAAPGTAVR